MYFVIQISSYRNYKSRPVGANRHERYLEKEWHFWDSFAQSGNDPYKYFSAHAFCSFEVFEFFFVFIILLLRSSSTYTLLC